MSGGDDKVIFSTDMKSLLSQLKDLDLANTLGHTSSESLSDILKQITEAKENARKAKEALRPTAKYVPPGGWKKELLEPKPLSKTATLEKSAHLKRTQMRTIAAFRVPESKWDGSFTLEPELEKSIYRTPCRDPSGTLYLNVGREPYKGDNVWKPSSIDQNLPPITVDLLTDSFKDRLVVHISTVVEKEQRIYDEMPVTTDAQRNIKAKHGADLSNLKHVKDHLLDAIVASKKKKI